MRILPAQATLQAAVFVLLASSCSSLPETGALDDAVIQEISAHEISFPAVVNQDGFENGSMPGYHAIVFKGGRSAASSLFIAGVTDVQVLDALESLGAQPGPTLSMETWDARDEPGNPAAEATIHGPAVEILVLAPGADTARPLSSFLMDDAGRGLQIGEVAERRGRANRRARHVRERIVRVRERIRRRQGRRAASYSGET